MERCGADALALYLLLVTVGDADGLSYYSDQTVARLLSLDEAEVRRARRDLLAADLISYERPLYQVLGLEPSQLPLMRAQRSNGCMSIGDVLRTAMGAER